MSFGSVTFDVIIFHPVGVRGMDLKHW